MKKNIDKIKKLSKINFTAQHKVKLDKMQSKLLQAFIIQETCKKYFAFYLYQQPI